MSHLDEQIAEALTHGPDTLTYIMAQALTAARARVAELEARRVVVPELTSKQLLELLQLGIDDPSFSPAANRINAWFCENSRAVSADRVLVEGERKVGSEEWMYLSALERYARKHGPESIQDVVGVLDHLRANQKGDES